MHTIGHPLVPDTMDLLESRVRAREITVFFTHLNHSNPLVDPRAPERAEVERRGFGVAVEGQRLPI